MGCICTKTGEYNWTDWNYCMCCKHFHNPETGKCGVGSFICVDKQDEIKVPYSYYVDASEDEKGRLIIETKYNTVIEDGEEPIYENTTKYYSTSNSHTTYHTEPTYDYKFNGTSWDYVQTGTHNVLSTNVNKSYDSYTEQSIVGYQKTKITKQEPVHTFRKVKTVTTYSPHMITKKEHKYITDCKCTKQKNKRY